MGSTCSLCLGSWRARDSKKQPDIAARAKKTDEYTQDSSEVKEDRRREIEEKTKAQDDSNYVKRRTQGGQSGSFGRTSENGREEGQVPKPPFEESRGREVKEEGEREEVPTREDAVPEELRQEVDDESLREVVPLPSFGGFPEGRDDEEEEEEEEEERSVHVYTGEEEGKKLLNGLKGTEEEEEGEGAQNKHLVNGFHELNGGQEEEEEEEQDGRRWSFPPQLEEFNLMDSETDPADLEAIFGDERLVDIRLTLDPEAPGLGISIAGGSGSPSGQDLPIVVKRILPATVAEKDGRLKPGDELVAVNDTLLVGVDKNYAVDALSNLEGEVRLLVLQDY